MKTIAFFVRSIDPAKPPFLRSDIDSADWGYAYQHYFLALNAAGAKTYFVSGNDTYEGEGRFSKSWTIEKALDVPEFHESGPIKADLVFEKGGFEGRDILTVSDPKIREICNKAETLRRFGAFQPKSVMVDNATALAEAVQAMPGDMVVVKNPAGSGGDQVYIARKNELKVPGTETYPLLVQEFVDMSEGVPGLAKGPHDLRILIAGGTVTGGMLRQPLEGRYHANAGQGASVELLRKSQIPAEAAELALKIDEDLKQWPRFYAADFARGKQGWKLIELNAKPGLFYRGVEDVAREHIQGLVSYLIGL